MIKFYNVKDSVKDDNKLQESQIKEIEVNNEEDLKPLTAVEINNTQTNGKVEKNDKQSFEDFKNLYKGVIDMKCNQEYGSNEDKDLWEDTAKELYLNSKEYILTGDEHKPEQLEKKTEGKKVESKEEMSFQQIIDMMEYADTYGELYNAAQYIADDNLRKWVTDELIDCEDNDDPVDVAYSVVTSDFLDSMVGKPNVKSSKKESKIPTHKELVEANNKKLNEENENDKFVVIHTGLNDKITEDILKSVIGQMSDGIWENTPGMDDYWLNMNVDKVDGEVVIKVKTNEDSPFKHYTESEIAQYIADKLRAVVVIEIQDGLDGQWSRDCDAISGYLTRNESVTIKDAYKVYDALLTNNKTESKEVKKQTRKRLPNISKFIYDLDVDKGNAWSVSDYTKDSSGNKLIIVRRNGKSENTADDIIKAVEKKYPQLKGHKYGLEDTVEFTLNTNLNESNIDKYNTIPEIKDRLREINKQLAYIRRRDSVSLSIGTEQEQEELRSEKAKLSGRLRKLRNNAVDMDKMTPEQQKEFKQRLKDLQLLDDDESNLQSAIQSYRNHYIQEFESYIKKEENNTDLEYRYMLLDRLKQDCEYFLGNGNGNAEHSLWAKDIDDQIAKMKELYNSFTDDQKPEWITMEDINNYEKEMKELKKSKEKRAEDIDNLQTIQDIEEYINNIKDEHTKLILHHILEDEKSKENPSIGYLTMAIRKVLDIEQERNKKKKTEQSEVECTEEDLQKIAKSLYSYKRRYLQRHKDEYKTLDDFIDENLWYIAPTVGYNLKVQNVRDASVKVAEIMYNKLQQSNKKTESMPDDWYNAMYDKYVPNTGEASTIGGEILRTFSGISRMFYQNGDKIWRGNMRNNSYVLDPLADKLDDLLPQEGKDLMSIMANSTTDNAYEKRLNALEDYVYNYLKDNDNLFGDDKIQESNTNNQIRDKEALDEVIDLAIERIENDKSLIDDFWGPDAENNTRYNDFIIDVCNSLNIDWNTFNVFEDAYVEDKLQSYFQEDIDAKGKKEESAISDYTLSEINKVLSSNGNEFTLKIVNSNEDAETKTLNIDREDLISIYNVLGGNKDELTESRPDKQAARDKMFRDSKMKLKLPNKFKDIDEIVSYLEKCDNKTDVMNVNVSVGGFNRQLHNDMLQFVDDFIKENGYLDTYIDEDGKEQPGKFKEFKQAMIDFVKNYDLKTESKEVKTEGTNLKRIARYNEFDNGYVLHNDWKKISDEEAEELAKQASIKDPTDVYYVQFDDIMNSSNNNRWYKGKLYTVDEINTIRRKEKEDLLKKVQQEKDSKTESKEGYQDKCCMCGTSNLNGCYSVLDEEGNVGSVCVDCGKKYSLPEIEKKINSDMKSESKVNLKEDQYEYNRRKGRPNVKKIAEDEYYDNQDWYIQHIKDYDNEEDFIKKEIAEIAEEYNLKENTARSVCKEIYKLAKENNLI